MPVLTCGLMKFGVILHRIGFIAMWNQLSWLKFLPCILCNALVRFSYLDIARINSYKLAKGNINFHIVKISQILFFRTQCVHQITENVLYCMTWKLISFWYINFCSLAVQLNPQAWCYSVRIWSLCKVCSVHAMRIDFAVTIDSCAGYKSWFHFTNQFPHTCSGNQISLPCTLECNSAWTCFVWQY